LQQELEALRQDHQSALDELRAEKGSQSGVSRSELKAMRSEQAAQTSAARRDMESLRTQQVVVQRQPAEPTVVQGPAESLPQVQVVRTPRPARTTSEQSAQVVRLPVEAARTAPVEDEGYEEPEETGAPARPGNVQVVSLPSRARAPQETTGPGAQPGAQRQEIDDPAASSPEWSSIADRDWPAAFAGVPSVTALDSNLLTNLMRWVGGVKRRLGAGQLDGFLEIYKLTGHLPPVVERLIHYLAALEALPDESSDHVFTLDDLVDSLLQLHAIVYGPGYAARGSLLDLEEAPSEGMEGDG
jgi:hypothetical protein